MSSIQRTHLGTRLTPLESDLVLCLKEAPKTLSDLRTRIRARDTSVLHAIKALESQKLISRDTLKHSYSLTSIGHAYAIMLDQLLGASGTLRTMEDFWLDHDMSGIPEHLLIGIRTLNDATVVKATASSLDAVHHRYLHLLKDSRRFHGVSPVFHPDFVGTTAEVLRNGADVKLVVTKDVLDRTRKEVKLRDLARQAKALVIDRNLEIYLRDGLKVGLTVTEKFISLGLFKLDGAYDYSVDLMSSHPQALEWGEQLFEYYRAIGNRVRFSSLL